MKRYLVTAVVLAGLLAGGYTYASAPSTESRLAAAHERIRFLERLIKEMKGTCIKGGLFKAPKGFQTS